MILSLEQVRSITQGTTYLEEENGFFRFHRFTAEQEALYESLHPDLAIKTPATAGVRLAFETDSNALAFQFRLIKASSRETGRIDVYVDGAMVAHTGQPEYRAGVICRTSIELGEGTKRVEIYLPWAMRADLGAIELDDGATLAPVSRRLTWLVFGDSITQGYDCKYPSLSYVSTVARLLDANELNKGIGGEVFFPELLEKADAIEPDLITVAYGTNDWSRGDRPKFETNCRAFYERLSALYPNAKIFALSPIWRNNGTKETGFGAPVTCVYDVLCEKTADLANVTVIRGDAFIPHLKAFTTDGLHPNDVGFQIYAQVLASEISAHL